MRKFLLTGLIVVLAACADEGLKNTRQRNDLNEFEWMLGSWTSPGDSSVFGETWMSVNDSSMAGIGYFVRNGDTVASEQLGLVLRNGKVYYVPAVSNQNKGKEVAFMLRDKSEHDWVFMNSKHDFPQQIRYTRFDGDSMEAVISGMVDGQLRSQSIPMKKMQP
ncbi:MAG: hypothetical protein GC180_02800 [Bacteroidetes bacterium]|nr:hypothetical protein [Bacteroidota bacterium]